MNTRLRKVILAIWLCIVFTGIAFLFWQNEWKYNLPTPVPPNFHQVQTGTFINAAAFTGIQTNKPLFLHFFNPSCPCSRFNMTHFKTLVNKYGDKIDFVMVVINKNNQHSADDIREKYELHIPVLFNGSIADSCGVYSTPQAAIIDTHSRLWYRGNYNKSRYCTEAGTNYAQIALDSLLSNHQQPLLSEAAYKSYGCQLSLCTKNK